MASTVNARIAELLGQVGRATSHEGRAAALLEVEKLRTQAAREAEASDGFRVEETRKAASYAPGVETAFVATKNTADSDWLIALASDGIGLKDAAQEIVAQATMWFQRTPDFVKEDEAEFRTQAAGQARKVASGYGDYAPDMAAGFIGEVDRLYGQAVKLGSITAVHYVSPTGQVSYSEDHNAPAADPAPASDGGGDAPASGNFAMPMPGGHGESGGSKALDDLTHPLLSGSDVHGLAGQSNSVVNQNRSVTGALTALGSIGAFTNTALIMQVEANQYIKQQDGKWVITQKGTGKVLSHHDSEEEAEASFRAMEAHKHGAKSDVCPKCGGHVTATVHGDKMTAKCDSSDCGWTGTKSKKAGLEVESRHRAPDDLHVVEADENGIIPTPHVRVQPRPNKSNRYDVHYVESPMSLQTVHQSYDEDEANRVADDFAREHGVGRFYSGPRKQAASTVPQVGQAAYPADVFPSGGQDSSVPAGAESSNRGPVMQELLNNSGIDQNEVVNEPGLGAGSPSPEVAAQAPDAHRPGDTASGASSFPVTTQASVTVTAAADPGLIHVLTKMNNGDSRSVSATDRPHSYTVSYHSEQAEGDDGRPAKGFTVGGYSVSHDQSGKSLGYYRHSPYNPDAGWSAQAKRYAAEQAAEVIGRHYRDITRHGSLRTATDMRAVFEKENEPLRSYLLWGHDNGHDVDDLSTLRKYETGVPGVGRSTTNKIADEYHGEDSDWRQKARMSSINQKESTMTAHAQCPTCGGHGKVAVRQTTANSGLPQIGQIMNADDSGPNPTEYPTKVMWPDTLNPANVPSTIAQGEQQIAERNAKSPLLNAAAAQRLANGRDNSGWMGDNGAMGPNYPGYSTPVGYDGSTNLGAPNPIYGEGGDQPNAPHLPYGHQEADDVTNKPQGWSYGQPTQADQGQASVSPGAINTDSGGMGVPAGGNGAPSSFHSQAAKAEEARALIAEGQRRLQAAYEGRV